MYSKHLLNNVSYPDQQGTVVLDLVCAGLSVTRFVDGSMILRLMTDSDSRGTILSGSTADLLAELLAGNLEAPTSGWTEGDVVTFEPAHDADGRRFTLQREADGLWAIHVDGVLMHRRSSWSDASVDDLLDGHGVYDSDRSPYANPTVIIRQVGRR